MRTFLDPWKRHAADSIHPPTRASVRTAVCPSAPSTLLYAPLAVFGGRKPCGFSWRHLVEILVHSEKAAVVLFRKGCCDLLVVLCWLRWHAGCGVEPPSARMSARLPRLPSCMPLLRTTTPSETTSGSTCQTRQQNHTRPNMPAEPALHHQQNHGSFLPGFRLHSCKPP